MVQLFNFLEPHSKSDVAPMTDLVFDLTEVFRASTGRFRMYGILRVVDEIAQAFVRGRHPIRFAVFSYVHEGFVEVYPKLEPDGTVDLAVPLGISEFRIRPVLDQYSRRTRAVLKALGPLMQRRNRTNWRKTSVAFNKIDMNGKTLVSASRPKIISDAMLTLQRKGCKLDVIPLLHDLIPLHKQFGSKTAYFPGKFLSDNQTILSRSRLVLANSEFTSSEITRFAQDGLLPGAIDVRTIQLAHECKNDALHHNIGLPRNGYILTVGATMGRKNLEVIFEALLLLHSRGESVPDLVMAGNLRRTTRKTLRSPKLTPIREFIRVVHEPDQADLVALYKGACAVVLPSRMEGWGLPAGEALWCETPVICSDAPALQEVCGELALYFDPDDPETLADHITQLTQNSAFKRAAKLRIADAKSELRTWSDVADDLLRQVNSADIADSNIQEQHNNHAAS